jgi:DNA-directed RNA polymerase
MQTISVTDPSIPSPVNPQKQSTAFPPNFIHSLDASHMMLSALECQKTGLTFASVHDSYWTHASDVDTMSNILRTAFIRLHSENIMERLRSELLERYSSHMVAVRIPMSVKTASTSSFSTEEIKTQGLLKTVKRKRLTRNTKFIKTWKPLRLDPLPKKGDFDVHEVSQSPYFFH